MSMVTNDGDSLDYGHYVGDIFDYNTGIWWHCDDTNITEIIDLTEEVYTGESNKLTKKKKLMSGSKDILFVVYIRTNHLIASSSIFPRIH